MEAELRIVPIQDVPPEMYTRSDDTLPRLARYPNLIEVLRSEQLQPGQHGSWMNRILVTIVLLMPLSSAIPIIWIDSKIAGPTSRMVLLTLSTAVYLGMGYDTVRLLRAYSSRKEA
jgi:hypothetical protein